MTVPLPLDITTFLTQKTERGQHMKQNKRSSSEEKDYNIYTNTIQKNLLTQTLSPSLELKHDTRCHMTTEILR